MLHGAPSDLAGLDVPHNEEDDDEAPPPRQQQHPWNSGAAPTMARPTWFSCGPTPSTPYCSTRRLSGGPLSSPSRRSVAPPERVPHPWPGGAVEPGEDGDVGGSASHGPPPRTRETTLLPPTPTPAAPLGSGTLAAGPLLRSAPPHGRRANTAVAASGVCEGVGRPDLHRGPGVEVGQRVDDEDGLWMLASPCATAPAGLSVGFTRGGRPSTAPPMPQPLFSPSAPAVSATTTATAATALLPPQPVSACAAPSWPPPLGWTNPNGGAADVNEEASLSHAMEYTGTPTISPPRRRTGRLSTVRTPPARKGGAVDLSPGLGVLVGEGRGLFAASCTPAPVSVCLDRGIGCDPARDPPMGGTQRSMGIDHSEPSHPLPPPSWYEAQSLPHTQEAGERSPYTPSSSSLAELEAAPRKSYTREECSRGTGPADLLEGDADLEVGRRGLGDAHGVLLRSHGRDSLWESARWAPQPAHPESAASRPLVSVVNPTLARADAMSSIPWLCHGDGSTATLADAASSELSQTLIPAPPPPPLPHAPQQQRQPHGRHPGVASVPYPLAPPSALTRAAVQPDGCIVDASGVLLSHITAATYDSQSVDVSAQLAQLSVHASPTQKRLAFDEAVEEASERSATGLRMAWVQAASTSLPAEEDEGHTACAPPQRWGWVDGRHHEARPHDFSSEEVSTPRAPRTVPSSPIAPRERTASPLPPVAGRWRRFPAAAVPAAAPAVGARRGGGGPPLTGARPTGLQLLESRKRCLGELYETAAGLGRGGSPGDRSGGDGEDVSQSGWGSGTSVDVGYLASIKRCRRESERSRLPQPQPQPQGSRRSGHACASSRRTSSAPLCSTVTSTAVPSVFQELPSNTLPALPLRVEGGEDDSPGCSAPTVPYGSQVAPANLRSA